MKYDVFISYSSTDQKIAEGLCAYLEQHKVRCFVAYRDIRLGEPFAEVIGDTIDECQMMIALFSESFNVSPQVDREITHFSNDKKPILTVRINDCLIKSAIRYYLSDLNWIDAFPNPEASFGSVLDSVKRLITLPALQEETEAKRQPVSINGHNAVDLGLSVRWATFNVGAGNPEEYGGYYAWGETEEKSDYSENTYKYDKNGSYINIGSNISGTGYDVAHVKWGGKWRMPTLAEQQELMGKCTWKWTTLNGVKGMKVTGPNGNSIFLPAAGSRYSTGVYFRGADGYYWSGSLDGDYYYDAWSLGVSDFGYDWDSYDNRYCGFSVRPVSE